MALSASLLMRQSQSLVMTPQLLQSIQLLQMTHLELNQFIATEIEKNPLLDLASSETDETGDARSAEQRATRNEQDGADDERPASSDAADDWYESRPEVAAARLQEIDQGFENVFPDDRPAEKADVPELLGQWKSMTGAQSGGDYDLEDFASAPVTLAEHLGQQVPFLLKSATERLIAEHLIDAVDQAGYFAGSTADIAERLGVDRQQAEAVLTALQTLDPPGVMARSLRECLAIQLKQRDRLDPAMKLLVDNLDLLARRDFTSLRRLCGVSEEDLLDMLAEIRTLNPKPGDSFERHAAEPVAPDVVVRPGSTGGWMVELNPDTLPRVLVNRQYFQSVSKSCAKHGQEQDFLAECLQNANWLTRSLDQRAKTILKVATEIVRQQDAFLVHGVDHLRPLTLKAVAEAIKMHESTVSRVTSNKYMLTPRGMFELKYFFSVSIGSTEDGGDAHSAEAVRHRIRALIDQESADAILSDDDIVISLKKGGVDLARRTVAKYREAMNIPSSVQRRREKRAMARLAAI
ncbi:RNA polymerase sigma-54 factor [Pseudorhizobium halotolerans]|uniref:RNA polymerase sigma-54 factor n=1 Tax=Pseudorhizobium halotolerans TaxID=1233081 RepID=A0ABM8PP24_9HYPH|nr:RNA polymerase factor sigma-54 [Pseudorhizobium halotolerans]CAD7040333.1 RNA polymerase sigma-54 factor [Pseudorhizobium halotolerans]